MKINLFPNIELNPYPTKYSIQQSICHTVWKDKNNSAKRLLFHLKGNGLGFEGQVHWHDGNVYNWNISGDILIVGELVLTILSFDINYPGILELKDQLGNVQTFARY